MRQLICMTESDFELLRAFASSGDDDAFAELVARHEGWIFVAARRRLKDDHLADDARQAVFLLLTQKAAMLVAEETPSVAAWLFHTMHFTCSSMLRTRVRQGRRDATIAGLRADDRPTPNDAALTMLEDTITQLPPRDREAIVRRFYQKESFEQIGAALGISGEAARKRVGRVLERCRAAMCSDGVDADPDAMFEGRRSVAAMPHQRLEDAARPQIESLVKGTQLMVDQMEAIQFAVMTAEFFVTSVEDSLDFFEKLGFRRHFVETLDADGTAPRAAMRGRHARLWLRRASKENPPAPGVIVYFWLEGGEPAVIRHRERIAAQGVAVNQFFYDAALMNFTVTTPDGYAIGFFSTYQPHTFDPKTDT